MRAITVNHLYKSYSDVEVLKGITLEIGIGEFYAIMGANGSGKTTLTSIIACTSLPTSGTMEVHGHDVVKEAEEVKGLIGEVKK